MSIKKKVSIIVSKPHNMAKAKDSELKEAFKLFDTDGDKMVSVSELKSDNKDRWRPP